MLGQPASWQTVCSPSRWTRPRSWVYCGPMLALTLIHGGLRSIGVSALRASMRSRRLPSGATMVTTRDYARMAGNRATEGAHATDVTPPARAEDRQLRLDAALIVKADLTHDTAQCEPAATDRTTRHRHAARGRAQQGHRGPAASPDRERDRRPARRPLHLQGPGGGRLVEPARRRARRLQAGGAAAM